MNGFYPKVSIITVSYNSRKTIEETICSVINQTYENIEYLIIDGGSTDGTLEIIKKYEHQTSSWSSEPDQGIYDAMNKGVQRSTGEIIAFLNSDDWYVKNDIVENIVKAFSIQNCDIVHGNIIYINEMQSEKFRIMPDLMGNNIYKRMIFNHPTCFLKKKLYEKFGCFDLKYRIAADYELILRFYTKHINMFYLNIDMVYFRYGGASTKNCYSMLKETKEISIKYGRKEFEADVDLWKALIKYNIKVILQKSNINFLIKYYRDNSKRYNKIE